MPPISRMRLALVAMLGTFLLHLLWSSYGADRGFNTASMKLNSVSYEPQRHQQNDIGLALQNNNNNAEQGPSQISEKYWAIATSMSMDTSTSAPRPTDTLTAVSAVMKNGVVTSVWGSDYASMALMLGWTIMQHNDLKSLNAEMILLTLPWDGSGIGLTAENKTRLQKVGWSIRELDRIQIDGVDFSQIQSHRRNNLNKLQPFGWEEYEKILYIDADTVVKGNIGELFDVPGDFAAAPDVWFDIPIDSRFNSGVMIFRPSREIFFDMMAKIQNQQYHDPHEGDQDFLQHYWKFRDWKLPFKYNLNIVMYEHYPNDFHSLWDDAVIIHFTIQKPSPDHTNFCHKPLIEKGQSGQECRFWGILDWYRRYFDQMLEDTGFQEIGPMG